jgi:hypothetical protein
MALESQGVQIRLAATALTTLTTVLDVESTVINWADGAADFAGAGFTTAMFVGTTDNTALKPVKAVATTSLTIHGTFGTTGSLSRQLTGYTMDLLGNITDFTGPGGSANVIDITSLDSTSREKMMGIADEGQLSMTLNYLSTDTGQNRLKDDRAARLSGKYVIMLTDVTTGSSAFPSFAYFNAYPLQFSIAGAVDSKITAQAVLEIDGGVIWSTKVT